MAVDTAPKRRSAVMTRRLPWFRRFQPAPDGSMDRSDRQQLAFVYFGIAPAGGVIGPVRCMAAAVYHPGAQRVATYQPGTMDAAVYHPGTKAARQ